MNYLMSLEGAIETSYAAADLEQIKRKRERYSPSSIENVASILKKTASTNFTEMYSFTLVSGVSKKYNPNIATIDELKVYLSKTADELENPDKIPSDRLELLRDFCADLSMSISTNLLYSRRKDHPYRRYVA